MSIFNNSGNLITKKPESESESVESVKADMLNLITDKFPCQYCDKEWDKKKSRTQHERWCDKNPNPRTYRTKVKEIKPKKIKPKIKISKEKDIIKELKEFDNTFGLTDKQIVTYIREKMRE